ncbi:thioredoxin family protein [Chitinimonas lacunae]|uniref:Thioredoxin family protein n=1 Tax=Chitinimonas lacunae TaxID=1963018 RepID=A0ABV8MKT7_9NEIS
MMKTWITGALVGAALLSSHAALAQAVVGQPAPVFTGTDASGKTVSLADFKGKYVVVEWTNPECPFVKKHYDSGNMPSTQKEAMAKGAVWVSIQTGAGQDEKARAQLAAWQKSKHSAPTATLLDADGKIGQSYHATTTPHMYIVNPQGTLIYAGAIDSKPTANPADIKTATNYVNQALGEAMAGKAVSQPTTKSYGCSVKYPGGA